MLYNLDVWTDGACRGNGQSWAIGGAGAWFSKPVNGARGWLRQLSLYPTPTNQKAELTGLIVALETASQLRDPMFVRLTVHTDSTYVIRCMTHWLDEWRVNGWVNAYGYSVANRDLIEEAAELVQSLDMNGVRLKFVWVPRDENREADRLANQACDSQEQRWNGNPYQAPGHYGFAPYR
ncbi:ribonuclease H1 [Mycena galopus ATCC 62051]|nr:ribonuclease H1 [Mycena galopus ATCC 62051]